MLCAALRDAGRLREARVSCAASLALAPDANTHALFCTVEGQLGDLDAAVGHCRAATALSPRYADAWADLGTGLLLRGGPGDAGEGVLALRRALELQPAHRNAAANLRRFAGKKAAVPKAAAAAAAAAAAGAAAAGQVGSSSGPAAPAAAEAPATSMPPVLARDDGTNQRLLAAAEGAPEPVELQCELPPPSASEIDV